MRDSYQQLISEGAKFKTINIGGLGIKINDNKKNKALEILELFTNNPSIFFIYREMDIPYLKARFLKPNDLFIEYNIMDKLFFMGIRVNITY